MPLTLPTFNLELRRKLRRHGGDNFGPPQYTDWVDEEQSWKQNCYLGDWSFLSSVRYTGPDVIRLFSDSSVNSMTNFAIGQSKHVIHTNTHGKVIEEGVLTRTGENEVLAYSTLWADFWRRNYGDYDVEMEWIDEVKYHLQGPHSLFVLEKLLGHEFRDLSYMQNSTATIAGVETRILRQGMSGEIGFELQAATEHGPTLWEAVMDAGAEFGIHAMGGRVAMLNHLQAGYPSHGLDYLSAIFEPEEEGYAAEVLEGYENLNEYYWAAAGSFDAPTIEGWYRSPIELGWQNRINFDHPFRGDEALRAELANPKRTSCTLVWNSADIADLFGEFFRTDGPLPDFMEMPQDPRGYLYFDRILKNGRDIGTTSSRGYSAHFREMISLGVIDVEFAQPGEDVTVIWGNPGTPQREIRAVTAPYPYKTSRARGDLRMLPRHR